jgi:signal transduction histidine kinase/CheY-like chemotaxis protein
VRKDGTLFWANVVIDPIREPDGTLLGFAKITRDITERRDNQIALEQAREALFQAQKMEAIGQLTGGVAHDFNNLLMAIVSGLELLRKRVPDDPRVALLLSNSMDAAKRGVNLTRRMLAFARRQDLAITQVDVGMLVNGISDLLERSIGPGIAIENEIPLNLPQVRVDANQLENALLNLVLNARDAMPNGGFIRIWARAEQRTTGGPNDLAEGAYVCLSVADTGQGMDAATLARAAEPFFTTKGVGKGTGLGLSMVHGMLAQLGGRMILKSRVGEGTTVELWLPVANADTAVRPQAASPVPRDAEAMPALDILLVDDDRLVLVNTTAMLEEFGHRVTAVSSAHQALTLLRTTEPVDVLVTDHAMPQMTGADLALAAAHMRPGLPVLLVSGYAELPEGVSRDLRRLGKPFTIEELENAIAGVMSAATKRG